MSQSSPRSLKQRLSQLTVLVAITTATLGLVACGDNPDAPKTNQRTAAQTQDSANTNTESAPKDADNESAAQLVAALCAGGHHPIWTGTSNTGKEAIPLSELFYKDAVDSWNTEYPGESAAFHNLMRSDSIEFRKGDSTGPIIDGDQVIEPGTPDQAYFAAAKCPETDALEATDYGD